LISALLSPSKRGEDGVEVLILFFEGDIRFDLERHATFEPGQQLAESGRVLLDQNQLDPFPGDQVGYCLAGPDNDPRELLELELLEQPVSDGSLARPAGAAGVARLELRGLVRERHQLISSVVEL
jgi:hypothetical protein